MKGYHPTPKDVVDLMVAKLFANRAPRPQDALLDPGCGKGEFIDGVLRWCDSRGIAPPAVVGVENDPKNWGPAHSRFLGRREVRIRRRDFLTPDLNKYDFIVGNPPYVPITGLDLEERTRYRKHYSTAVERFDLYLLFFEQGLRLLAPGGRLCFITPEKFEYTHSAAPLRRLLANYRVSELDHLAEETFPGLVTYPTVTTVENPPRPVRGPTMVRFRDGTSRLVELPVDGTPWVFVPTTEAGLVSSPFVLQDICVRVSCGIATGADALFVLPTGSIPATLRPFAYPTVSGRQLGLHGPEEFKSTSSLMVPYDRQGKLLPETKLGDFLTFLSRPDIARHLKERTCVAKGSRAWYRFHDNVPLGSILNPKILTKDITSEPHFWADYAGGIVPRHTVYYIVPKHGVPMGELLSYLNSQPAKEWLKARSQRAANGFYRVQSAVLKSLPVPAELARKSQVRSSRSSTKNRLTRTPRAKHRQATLQF